MTSSPIEGNGATAVITHRVRSDKHAAYESWLEEIAPLCRASPGHLDWHVVKPIHDVTHTYTVIIRFDTTEHLKLWMGSQDRDRLIKKVEPFLVGADDFYISSGLDFWFTPAGAKARVPVRWKQFLITWSAIFPLAIVTPWFVAPPMGWLGIAANSMLTTLAVTAVIVYLMIYAIMPHYTRLVQRWLFT